MVGAVVWWGKALAGGKVGPVPRVRMAALLGLAKARRARATALSGIRVFLIIIILVWCLVGYFCYSGRPRGFGPEIRFGRGFYVKFM